MPSGSTGFKSFITTPIGMIGNSVTALKLQGLYIGAVSMAKAGMEQAGGPTVVFVDTSVTLPAKLKKAVGDITPAAPARIPGMPTSADLDKHAAAQDAARKKAQKDAASKQAAGTLANTPNTANTDDHDASCKCSGCSCTLMRRDSARENNPFKRAASLPACPTCCKCKH